MVGTESSSTTRLLSASDSRPMIAPTAAKSAIIQQFFCNDPRGLYVEEGRPAPSGMPSFNTGIVGDPLVL